MRLWQAMRWWVHALELRLSLRENGEQSSERDLTKGMTNQHQLPGRVHALLNAGPKSLEQVLCHFSNPCKHANSVCV